MSFNTRVVGFAERFLSPRTFELIVAPAVADLQFETDVRGSRRTLNRLAVLRALAGGLREDVSHGSREFVALALLPACYYVFLLILCFDFFSISLSTGFFAAAALIAVISVTPAMVCFWPERRTSRSAE